MDWEALARRSEARYADGEGRLPVDGDAGQKQLVRMAMAAGSVGLARLMQGRAEEAPAWLLRSAERYRESWEGAPPGSWGRPLGAVKARVLAGDWPGARADAHWALGLGPAQADSPIAWYVAALAHVVTLDDKSASDLAGSLLTEETFPRPVALALAALAGRDRDAYARAAADVLRSFEERDTYVEGVPVADTVLVLEALASQRGMAAGLDSPLLPGV